MSLVLFLSVFTILGTKSLFGDKPVTLGSIVLTSLLSGAVSQLASMALGAHTDSLPALSNLPTSYAEALDALLRHACALDTLRALLPASDIACANFSRQEAEVEAASL